MRVIVYLHIQMLCQHKVIHLIWNLSVQYLLSAILKHATILKEMEFFNAVFRMLTESFIFGSANAKGMP